MQTPQQTYLTAYPLDGSELLLLQPLRLPGAVSGLVWGDVKVSGAIVDLKIPTPTALYTSQVIDDPRVPFGRKQLIDLSGIEAPYPRLHDAVDEAFYAFRDRLAAQVGWDLLASLENAYVPLTNALEPGRQGQRAGHAAPRTARSASGKYRRPIHSATLTSPISTGTSTSGPITAANAAPLSMPKLAIATAIASSKLFDAAVNDSVADCA